MLGPAVPARLDIHLAELAREFERALVRGDARRAEGLALDAAAAGTGAAAFFDEVLAPALHSVGERWEAGELSVADEHLATGIAQGVIALLARGGERRPARSRERVLLAGVDGEGHVVGLRLLADLAEAAGFDVRYLGAAVPVETLRDVVDRHDPAVVGLTATMPEAAAELRHAVDEVLAPGPRHVLVGGRGVPDALRADPRVRHAADARSGLALVEELVRAP